MDVIKPDQMVFETVVQTETDWKALRLMIESLRTFGGVLSQCPVWVFASHPLPANAVRGEGAIEGVEIFPLAMPDAVRDYLFAKKVFACAQAEAMAKERARSLVCIDPGVLVVNTPLLFNLGDAFDAALRPVHIKNVGLEAGAPLDGFWSKIYAAVGLDDIQQTVETFVGRQRIRAYFNSHAIVVNPSLGLLKAWAEMFHTFVDDKVFQATYCVDELHQIFLFQALLSAILVSRLKWQRIRILPPDYNYPYNLQSRISPGQQARSLNDLVCVAYEDRSLDPDGMADIRVDEPLRSWLALQNSIK